MPPASARRIFTPKLRAFDVIVCVAGDDGIPLRQMPRCHSQENELSFIYQRHVHGSVPRTIVRLDTLKHDKLLY